MSSVWTDRLNSGYPSGVTPTAGVVAAVAFLLAVHHTEVRSAGVPALEPAVAAPAALAIHAGHGARAAHRGWEPARSFRRVALGTYGRFAALDSLEQLTILKINRVDRKHAARRPLFVPDSLGDELSYSPMPAEVSELAPVPRILLVSRRVQAFAAYEHGVLVRWGPTSTGKAATPTDAGLFFTNWKARKTVSTDDPSWILEWYVNFISDKGVAFHQYDLPGYPGSHGCVRLLEEDARWIYRWTAEWELDRRHRVVGHGTPVLVMGDYDTSQPAPWQRLAEDPLADRVGMAEIRMELAEVLPEVLGRTRD